MAKKIILIIVILLLAGAAFTWFNSTAESKKMTTPIEKQLSNRSGSTFEIMDTERSEEEGSAIVTISDKEGASYTEKYFMIKNEGVWVIDRTEAHTPATK